MPNQAALRVCRQIVPADHHFAFLEILANREGKQVLVDLSLLVELLNQKRGALPARNGRKAYNSVTRHPRETLLIDRGDEGHAVDALVARRREAHLVARAVAPDVPAAVAHLAHRLRLLLERFRLFVPKVVRRCARLALRCLHPEPRAARVEDKLVGFVPTPEVHRRKDLDVEEVA